MDEGQGHNNLQNTAGCCSVRQRFLNWNRYATINKARLHATFMQNYSWIYKANKALGNEATQLKLHMQKATWLLNLQLLWQNTEWKQRYRATLFYTESHLHTYKNPVILFWWKMMTNTNHKIFSKAVYRLSNGSLVHNVTESTYLSIVAS